jgi:hypothetical protein
MQLVLLRLLYVLQTCFDVGGFAFGLNDISQLGGDRGWLATHLEGV